MHGGLHRRSIVDRPCIPRVLGGRDLSSVRDFVEEEVLNVGQYIADSSERFSKTAEEDMQFVKELNTIEAKKRKMLG